MKKAQFEIQETILVIFIFLILLIIAFAFFFRYTQISAQNEQFEYEKNNFNNLITLIPNTPEFKCSIHTKEEDCIDISKLISFKQLNSNYFNEFGYKNITIYVVYPETHFAECSYYNHLDCGIYSVYINKPNSYKNTLIISSPVSLYYPDINEYKVGKLIVTWYI